MSEVAGAVLELPGRIGKNRSKSPVAHDAYQIFASSRERLGRDKEIVCLPVALSRDRNDGFAYRSGLIIFHVLHLQREAIVRKYIVQQHRASPRQPIPFSVSL